MLVIYMSQCLGIGAFGAVYLAKDDNLPCAAKFLHQQLIDPSYGRSGQVIMDKFQQECALLESFRHPNIVQYLGMTMNPDSGLHVLLMELLHESLTKMLEFSPQPLAYYLQLDICSDIALGIAYLHFKKIIHRDLSSNNVLMTAGRRAKLTDFGMSQLVAAAPRMTPLTMCPGTLAFMPPEAIRDSPRYSVKFDCFSFGVLMIQVCTRQWPEPGPRWQEISDPRSPTGTIAIPILESERRKNHIDLIPPNHSFLSSIMDCLKYNESERPSSAELCQRLADLKDSIIYRSSMEQEQDEISMLTQQLHERELEKQKIIEDKDRALQQKQEEIASQEKQLRWLNQQLNEQEQVTAEFWRTNHTLQRQVKEIEQIAKLTPVKASFTQVEHPPPSRLLSCSKEQEYLATLLYKEIRTGGKLCFHLYVVITWNINTHLEVVKSYFNTAQVYSNQLVTFVSDRVELKVSSENWTITQINSNVVEKKAIDNLTPGRSSWIPHSQFKASLPCAAYFAGNIPTLECVVHLNGFEAPHNKFTVHIDPSVMPAAGEVKLPKKLKSGPIENPDRLFNNLAVDICDKYMEIGIDLGLQDKILRNELESGEFKMLQGNKKAMRMLQLWRQSIGEDDLTYSELASALEKHGFGHCAIKYCYS